MIKIIIIIIVLFLTFVWYITDGVYEYFLVLRVLIIGFIVVFLGALALFSIVMLL